VSEFENPSQATPAAEIGPTITAMFKDGPLAGAGIEAEVVEGRAPKTLDAADDEGTSRYCLAGWVQSGRSAVYTFLYRVWCARFSVLEAPGETAGEIRREEACQSPTAELIQTYSAWRHERHSPSRRSCRSTRSAGAGDHVSPLDVGEDALRPGLQARGRLDVRRRRRAA
jgi:hypothetical protein